MDVVELGAHHRAEDAPPAMRRRDADDGHACAADAAARDRELERKTPAPPTMLPFSNAACMRSSGKLCVKRSARSRLGSAPKYWPIARNASSNSSRFSVGRTSNTQNTSGQNGGSGVRKSSVARSSAPSELANPLCPSEGEEVERAQVRAGEVADVELELGLVVGPPGVLADAIAALVPWAERVAYREHDGLPARIRARAARRRRPRAGGRGRQRGAGAGRADLGP